MDNTIFLAQKTNEWKSAYLSVDFCPDLKIRDFRGQKRKFFKILWDYIPESDPEVLKWAGKEIAKIAKKVRAEVILGIESSGIHFAASASIYSNLPYGFIRRSAKDYGLGRIIEGEFGSRKRVLVVDNFVFSGGTMVKAVKSVRESGLKVVSAVSIDCFDTLPKDPEFSDLPFEFIVKNSEKIASLIKLKYFPATIVPYLEKYVYSPGEYFEPSESHEQYAKELSLFKENKIIVWQGKINVRKKIIQKIKSLYKILPTL